MNKNKHNRTLIINLPYRVMLKLRTASGVAYTRTQIDKRDQKKYLN